MGKKDNATQQGAETTDDTVVEPTPHLNPRAAAMDAIAEKHDAAVREELGLPPDEDSDKGESVNIDTPAPDEKPEERKVIKPAEDAAPDKPYRKMVDGEVRWVTKVDGEERIADDDEIIRGYQKNQTASKRLEEAAARQKELDAREAAIRAEEARIAEQITKIQTPLSEPQGSVDVPGVDDDTAQAFLDAVYEGDNTKAKKLLGKLQLVGRSNATQPSVDLDAIAAQAAARAKAEIKTEEAMEKFQRDYQDIVSNPHLAKVADGFLDEEIRNKPFAEALEEAGRRTREWIAEITQKPAETPSPRRSEALAKKEAIDNLPSQSSVSGTTEEAEESVTDVIKKMRQSRGLPV